MPCRDLSLLVVHRYLEGVWGEGCEVWDVGVQNFVVDNFVYNCLVTSNLFAQIDCLNPPDVYAYLSWVCK